MIALEATLSDIQFVRNILDELGIKQQEPILVLQDNKSAITLEEGGYPTTKTKHLDWRKLRINELIRDGTIRIEYLPSGDLSADMMTKPLQRSTFERFRASLLRESS
jgi:hypothetical protein